MKRFLLPLAAIMATALPGAAMASVHVWGLGDNTSTTTSTYQPQTQFLTGSPGPGAGALISRQSSGANGFQGGIQFRTASQKARVMGDTGALTLSGGLDDAQVGPGVAFAHARVGMGVTDLFIPGSPVQVDVGAAVGYTVGRTPGGADIARFRATPELSVAYKAARFTYRQSPWSEPGMSAPRDILGHLYFYGYGPVRGMGALTVGALVPDARGVASDGYVVAVRTPRWHQLRARLAYVSGLQGVTAHGPFNPDRPWDSYSAGEFANVSYQVARGVSVGLYAGFTHNTAGSETTSTITETSARGRMVGLTLADHF